MVIIRLARRGAKKRPFYHIQAMDSRSARNGAAIERIGYFNPLAKGQEKRLQIDMERVTYWRSCGANLSDRVKVLIKQEEKRTKQQEEETALAS